MLILALLGILLIETGYLLLVKMLAQLENENTGAIKTIAIMLPHRRFIIVDKWFTLLVWFFELDPFFELVSASNVPL